MFSIKQAALSVGFDACGIAKAAPLTEDASFLKEWLEMGFHADMNYLERNFEKRSDPSQLVPGCKSVVVVLMNYYPGIKQKEEAPQIAKYAYSSIDYHQVLKSKLLELEHEICNNYGANCVSGLQHSFVDSAPILERRWAQRAGLGWIGKHTQLIHTKLGSYTFIGTLLLNIETEYDTAISPKCGNCTACIDACPTNALNNGVLDANKCISYQTIENKNKIPTSFYSNLSNCAFGCDICADVCPWNKKLATPHSHAELFQKNENFEDNYLAWETETWLKMDKVKFNRIFKNSALKRAGFTKIAQNVEILNQTKK